MGFISFLVCVAGIACITGITGTRAQTSLYIPGFDPQPLSVNVVGVGSDGRTTWQIVPDPASLDDDAFIGTATLVEGPNDAFITVSAAGGLVYGETCTFSNGQAICTANNDGTTMLDTEPISSFAVKGSGTLANAPSGAAPTSSPQSRSPTSGLSTSKSGPSQSSPTQTSGNTAPSSGPSNGAHATSLSALILILGIGLVVAVSL